MHASIVDEKDGSLYYTTHAYGQCIKWQKRDDAVVKTRQCDGENETVRW